MNTDVMKKTTTRSLAGTMTFPEVVADLLAEGVESYHADLVRLEKTFYMPNGETFVESLDFEPPQVANDFSDSEVVSTLRAIQAKEINYQEFLRRIMKAGTTSYIVYLSGKKAIYFGRKGEFYVENFPQSAQQSNN